MFFRITAPPGWMAAVLLGSAGSYAKYHSCALLPLPAPRYVNVPALSVRTGLPRMEPCRLRGLSGVRPGPGEGAKVMLPPGLPGEPRYMGALEPGLSSALPW